MKKIFPFLLVVTIMVPLTVFSQTGWIQVYNEGLSSQNSIQDIAFVNPLTGYATGGDPTFGYALKTTNGGQSWNTILTTGTALESVSFINENIGYVVGGYNPLSLIYKTTNGGQSWVQQISGTQYCYFDSYFLNETTGLVVGDWGSIRKTTNGGNTWFGCNSGTPYYLESIYFTNQNTGFSAGREGQIIKTTDGGNNWNLLFQTETWLNSIKFFNENVGYVVGFSGKVLKTINGGGSWQNINIGITYNLTNIFIVNENIIYFVGDNGNVLKTVNGGLNWTQQNVGSTNNLSGVYFLDSQTGFTSGANASIYKTQTGGEVLSPPTLILPANNSNNVTLTPTLSWNTVLGASGYNVKISTDINFTNIVDSSTVINIQYTIAIGKLNNQTKYYWKVVAFNVNGTGVFSDIWNFTTQHIQSGTPWTLYNTGVPYSLFGVDFSTTNNNIGVAVGQGGTVIKTTDAGEEWTLTYQNINIWMNDVQFDPNIPGQVWAAGMGGVIIKSNDYGSTWTVVRPFSTPDHTIRGIAVKPGAFGYVSFVGYAGTFFETNNNGASFVQRFDIPYTMHSIAYSPNFPVDGRGIISGTDGKVWNTTNYGANWIARNTYRYDYLNDVVFLTPEVAMICGNNGTILRSTNWGRTWSVNVQYLTSEHLRSIDAYNEKVTVCGDNGKIMTASDWGITFVDQLNGENRHFYGVALRSANIGVVVGEVGTAGNGALYFTSMNGYVGITQTGAEVPKEYSMSQNYPNPFNPTTKINYTLPKQGFIKLTVYNMLGKEVANLINNEFKTAGAYTIEFSGHQLPSGVYFYILDAGEYKETKRMMLIK